MSGADSAKIEHVMIKNTFPLSFVDTQAGTFPLAL